MYDHLRNNLINILTVKLSNTRVVTNNEVVKMLMDIVLCLAKHYNAYKGNMETNKDLFCVEGKFCDWFTVFA